ncbi:MAG: response regulator [Abitibacteriaceae bacterium]|nr:response regulator [Abditibacteriaceae bacterium]MBV9865466.1 response regulator [Abditibacteriaceae bacterium]
MISFNIVPTKILIVDDEADIIEVVRLSLMSEGYDFIDASTGQEALTQAKIEKPDLIIMDVSMPEMDGFETLRRLKQHTATAHIRSLC